MVNNLSSRLDALETKLAFQEHTLEALNQMVIILQQENAKLSKQLQLISEKLKTAQLSQIASASEETLPPHY